MAGNWHSLRALDEASARPKGSSFRAFKQIEAQLREPIDYRVLRPDHPEFEKWRAQLYPGAQRAILLSTETAERIRAQLAATSASSRC